MTLILPSPSVCGLPPRFANWRAGQDRIAARAIETAKRFPTIVAPTGTGKTLVAEVIARYTGRSCYLTITKGLQDIVREQIADRYDIRGKSNYDCRVLVDQGIGGWQARVNQADAMCDQCRWREAAGGCEYYERGRRAKHEQHVNTNYAKFLSSDAEQLGKFDVLILDECHGAAQQISNSLRAELYAQHVEEFCGQALPSARSLPDWRAWASRQIGKQRVRLDMLAAAVASGSRTKAKELRELKALVRGLEGVLAAGDDWIEDGSQRTHPRNPHVAFEPVWPRAYGERLFRGTQKVVLLSATVHPKTLDMLGISAEDVDFAEYPSSFPIERRPVMWVRTVQQRQTMSDDERQEAVQRIDQIIDSRLDRKGIVDTVSFDRAKYVLQHSRHAGIMLLNDQVRKDRDEIVERFKASAAPRVLVTPSVKEGYDFPYDECEFSVIMKVPLLNRHNSPVDAARCKEDGDYDNFQAMQGIVQRAGRGMRAVDDSCETIIVDDTWGNWFLKSAERFAPRWFMAAYKGAVGLPRPLPKL